MNNKLELFIEIIALICVLIGNVLFALSLDGMLSALLVTIGVLIHMSFRTYESYKCKNIQSIIIESSLLCLLLCLIVNIIFFLT